MCKSHLGHSYNQYVPRRPQCLLRRLYLQGKNIQGHLGSKWACVAGAWKKWAQEREQGPRGRHSLLACLPRAPRSFLRHLFRRLTLSHRSWQCDHSNNTVCWRRDVTKLVLTFIFSFVCQHRSVNAVTNSINTENNHNKTKELNYMGRFCARDSKFVKTHLTSMTFKSTGVETGLIKKTTAVKKNPDFSDKNTDYFRSFLDELGINASQFTASRLHTGPI